MSQTDTESEAVEVKPFPAIRRELPKRHPEHPETMETIEPAIDKSLPTPTLTKVSIVIPVYNEEPTVQALVSLVVNAPLPGGLRREVICVNDCSKDGTAKKLDQLPALFPEADFRIILNCNLFGFETEITSKINKIRTRMRIFEVSIT